MKIKKFQGDMKKFGKVLKKILKRLMVVKELNLGKILKIIKFESNDDLPMNKPIRLHLLTIIIRCVFIKGGKFYPQLFYKKNTARKNVSEGIDINKTCLSKECELCHYWFFRKILGLNLKSMFVMDVMIY